MGSWMGIGRKQKEAQEIVAQDLVQTPTLEGRSKNLYQGEKVARKQDKLCVVDRSAP